MNAQTLRPYGLAAGGAMLFYIAANILIFFLFIRPEPPAAMEALPPPNAPVEVAAVAGDNLLADPAAWLAVAGEWQPADGMVTALAVDLYDFAYLYQQPVAQAQFGARIRHNQGIGGGLLFHAADSSTARGAHMVRFYDDTSIVWGFFDEAGVFQGQGSAPVAALGAGPHTLEVMSDGATYAIRVDDVLVVQGVPVRTQGDFFGLTASQSEAVFEMVTTSGMAPTATAAAPSRLMPGKGDWVEQDGAIIQRSTEYADLYAGLGFQGQQYSASADIQWPLDNEAPATGGGLLFNMSEPAKIEGAHMVRFSQNGREVFWGYFDDAGIFQGDGGAALDLNLEQPHTLQVVVGASTYAVYVDGALVAENRPLRRQGGYVGLLTYRGPITFSNIQLAAAGGS